MQGAVYFFLAQVALTEQNSNLCEKEDIYLGKSWKCFHLLGFSL